MRRNSNNFALGKLKHEYLAKLISNLRINDKRIISGSKIGEDFGKIRIYCIYRFTAAK